MVERRFKTDICKIDASKIDSYEHDIFGPVTVFKDVVIARAIVHKYDDGMAYKPGKELQAGYWTADGMWAIAGGHPAAAIIATRDEIHGRTVNVRFSRSLIDPDTKRPMNRGILADLEVFDNRVSPELLNDMKSGKKNEVSIGFFFDFDDVAGVVDDEEDKALNGTAYDYVQRNIKIDHVAFGIDNGRCPMPYCGIGADGVIRKSEGDPVGPYETFAICVAAIMKKNPSYTKEQAEGTCGKMEHQGKEKDITDVDDNSHMNAALEAAKEVLKEALSKLDEFEVIEDDLVEEEYQGNARSTTLSKRAKMFHSISDPDWDALTEEEKLGYINKLPPEKQVEGTTNKDEEHEPCVEGLVWSTEENKCVPADKDDEEEDREDCGKSESDVKDKETDAKESDEDDVAEILETTEDELDPDTVLAKYRRTLEDKDYPY